MSDFVYLTDPRQVGEVLPRLAKSEELWIDFETTGLHPRSSRARLLQIHSRSVPPDNKPQTFVVDLWKAGLTWYAYLLEVFENRLLGAHHLGFELLWLNQMAREIGRPGFAPSKPICTYVLHKLQSAGREEAGSLEACCLRELNVTLDKTCQVSDWSADPLSGEQLAYAANDVRHLGALFGIYWKRLKEAKMMEVTRLELMAVPAFAWMTAAGVAWDGERWQALLDRSIGEAKQVRAKLDEMAPVPLAEFKRRERLRVAPTLFDLSDDEEEQALVRGEPIRWNWDSPKQTLQALQEAGVKIPDPDDKKAKEHGYVKMVPIPSTGEEVLALANHPLAEELRNYRAVTQRIKMFGDGWFENFQDGRLWPSWRQMGAETGRCSASNPNVTFVLQGKDPWPQDGYRSCFRVPEDSGRCLVICDYSQIELRIMARISGDQAMTQAYQEGRDIHTETARNVLGISGEVSKADRNRAKALNFGLIYGLGVPGLITYTKALYGIELDEHDAAKMHTNWFSYYRGIKEHHLDVKERKPRETRTLFGRRREIPPDGQYENPETGERRFVSYFSARVNSPVQGSGADALKTALGLLWKTREKVPSAVPVIACHDELVVEVDWVEAENCCRWLATAMLEAWGTKLDPVPVGPLEPTIAMSWAEKG